MSGDAPQSGGAPVPVQALESLLQELNETPAAPPTTAMPSEAERRRTSLTTLPSAARRNSLTPLPSHPTATITTTNSAAKTTGTTSMTNFSTYGTHMNEADLVPVSQHGPTRLGVRLSPLSPSKLQQPGTKPVESTDNTTTTVGSVKSATKLSGKAMTSKGKPVSPAGTSTKAARPPATAAPGRPSPRILRAGSAGNKDGVTPVLPPLTQGSRTPTQGKTSGSHRDQSASGDEKAHAEDEKKDDEQGDEANSIVPPPECNFLPIMCARYLRPAGLTPSARWGHTLTPMRATRPVSLLLFGGRERDGAETNTLMSYDTEQVAWEPVHIARGKPPAARYYHAACAADDGRWLLIHGGAARADRTVFADLHCFDVVTGSWRCLWSGETSATDKNVPCARFAHTMLLREDKLYIYGGKVLPGNGLHEHSGGKRTASKAAASSFTLASSDVYVFSLNTLTWQKRLRATRKSRTEKESGNNDVSFPAPRAHHAACVQGSLLFLHGGVGSDGQTLTDTWQLQLRTGRWRCLHDGTSPDAIPREKHALFACGEGLLVVGGCGSSTVYTERLSSQFSSFVAVLPRVSSSDTNGAGVSGQGAQTGQSNTNDTQQQATTIISEPKAYWIPVAMGNLSIVAPNRRGFAAAMQDGFVYVFGGTSGAEPATNGLVRFLAADGVVTSVTSHAGQNKHSSSEDDGQRLRTMMQAMRSRSVVPYDVYAAASVWTGGPATTTAASDVSQQQATQQSGNTSALQAASLGNEADVFASNSRHGIGLHRAIVQARAPKLWAALQACRSEPCMGTVRDAGTVEGRTRDWASHTAANSDALDQLMQTVLPSVEQGGDGGNKGEKETNGRGATTAASNPVSEMGPRVYYTHGTSRLPGLPHALGPEELSCLTDYIYWAGLPAAFRLLLRDHEDESNNDDEDNDKMNKKEVKEGVSKEARRASGEDDAEEVAAVVNTSQLEREQTLRRMLHALSEAAVDYALPELGMLCQTLLTCPTRRALATAQAACRSRLVADLQSLCRSGANATMTVLFVDPHTKAQQTRVLHPCIAAQASTFFADLLRPLYLSEKATSTVRSGIVAKASSGAGALLQATSKRTIVIGPVPIPLVAVEPMMRFLYTQQLRVPREAALVTMLGAHELSLHALQQFCEASVAREEVNYESCCSLYYLACKHGASFLEEIALLTAVSGYSMVRRSDAFLHLPADEKERIESVVHELGTESWQPPPQPMHEMKSSTEYNARWAASALPTL